MRLVLNQLSIHNFVHPFLILQFLSMGHKSCSKMHLKGSSIFLNFDPQRFYAKAKTSLSVCYSNCQEWHLCAKVVILPLFGALQWWENISSTHFVGTFFSTAFVSAFFSYNAQEKGNRPKTEKSADFFGFSPKFARGWGWQKLGVLTF